MSLSVYFETFGCQMNVSDTEQARQMVQDAGLSLAVGPEGADVVMLNTCSVRAKAERKVLARVDELRHLQGGRSAKQLIGVMGCVAQLEGEGLFDAQGKVGLVAGTQAVERLPELIEEAYRGQRVLDLGPRETNGVRGNDNANVYERAGIAARHSGQVAFVPVIEGCNKFCSYCIVPYARGREISRPAADVLKEVEYLRDGGVKEVHLIGQNVNSYRPASDNTLAQIRGATPFARLLRAVAETGIPRIKFTTSFPRDFHEDIVGALEENPNLCNWIHLPVQSGSNSVLKAMRRGYTREEYLKKAEIIRKSSRKIAFTTDFIVGYPGEREADFRQTLELFEECSFDNAYLFKYSPRPGTPSFQVLDDVTEKEKTERFQTLQTLQKERARASLEREMGQILEVLAEKRSNRDPSNLSGHSTCQQIVNFPGPPEQIGKIAKVKITAIKANSLFGEAL